MREYAFHILRDVALAGIGDESRERAFRMCITLCVHRGVRRDELAQVDRWWHDARPADLAGGPIEIYYSRGIPDIPSAMPCAHPSKRLIDRRRLDLWLPIDCGECESCIARKNVRLLCAI
jgi:hypothetical protein